MSQQILRGIAWNHSRAFPPLVATAQRFEELFPSVRIQWEKRTLHEFGHMSLNDLARDFDLLVVDHPMMGDAHASGVLIDLATMIPPPIIDEVRSDSFELCFNSYIYEGRLYALPIDAAAPAACCRPDLLAARRFEPPCTWDDLIVLGRRGVLIMPGFPADLFLNFMGLYVSVGGELSVNGSFLDDEAALASLALLLQLAQFMQEEIYAKNPISIYEWMATGSTAAYCPFAYTYSNYARDGFANHCLEFTSPVTLNGTPIRTVLGGTGIAISSRCSAPDIALEYCLRTSGRDWQRALYGICGGQPARRSSWKDPALNGLTRDFFRQTQASMERAYIRPRYPGYPSFQESAGAPLVRFLRRDLDPANTLGEIRRLHDQRLGS